MNRQLNKKRGFLGVAIAFLSALVLLTFPFAFNATWSQGVSDADRTLTYTTDATSGAKLEWDTTATTNPDGTINLEIFKSEYDNAKSTDGTNIVAPGTSNSKKVCIANKCTTSAIRYYATAYRADGTLVRVKPVLSGDGEPTTESDYYYPKSQTSTPLYTEGMCGIVKANEWQEVTVGWDWAFEEDTFQDSEDTKAGENGSNEVTYSLYVVAEEVQTKDVTIVYNNGTDDETQTVVVGETAKQPAEPVRVGYKFAGWYSDAACTQPFDFSQPVTQDTTVYVKWEEDPTYYIVTFDTNGGSDINQQRVASGAGVTKPVDPTRKGYAFDGWYSDEALTTPWDFSTPVTDNMTLYAKWTQTHTVTFNSNGGSAIKSQTVRDGDVATKPADPTKDGYTFAGWFSDEALANAFDFSTKVTANTTLYAKWTQNAVNPDDGTDADTDATDGTTDNNNSTVDTSGFNWDVSTNSGTSNSASSAKAKGMTIPTTGDGLSSQMLVVFAMAVVMLIVVVVAAIRDSVKRRRAASASVADKA